MKPRQGKISEESAVAEVHAIYRELASRPVERNCTGRTECCQFKLTGRTPWLTRGEALVAARGWRSTGRRALPVREDGVCPMLDEKSGKCMIYAHRPFGCRTHFCRTAGGALERSAVIDLIRRLETLDASIGGSGDHPLQSAVAAELAAMR
jgi:Fe-S-cluster containining protein